MKFDSQVGNPMAMHIGIFTFTLVHAARAALKIMRGD